MREVFVEPAARAGAPAPSCWSTRSGKLAGLFTDSDLARLFETTPRRGARPADSRSHDRRGPATVPQGSMMVDAVAIMAERKISELPVIDAEGRPRG